MEREGGGRSGWRRQSLWGYVGNLCINRVILMFKKWHNEHVEIAYFMEWVLLCLIEGLGSNFCEPMLQVDARWHYSQLLE